MVLDIEEEIATRIAAIEAEPHASVAPTDVRREILFINDTVHTTGTETREGGLRGLTQVEVKGICSPHSSVTRGIIRFRPQDELRAPYYKEADQTIRLWLDVRHLDHVTFQLTHKKRWLWIGIWPDGYTYAALDSRP